MNYEKYECFQASYQGRVLTLTMNRPADMNAVNKEMHDELGTIFLTPSWMMTLTSSS